MTIRPELDANIVTLSYNGDYEYCRLLCESADEFLPTGLLHRLYVPTRDIDLFSSMASRDRVIGSQDRDLLPSWLMKLPMPGARIRNLLHLPRRNVYLSLRGKPVRGWIAQQIMKIDASVDSPTEIVVHIDSDSVFIRPLSLDVLVNPDGAVRFYRNPVAETRETHILWREVACRLLGIDPAAITPGDYINQCVVWRRSTVQRMVQRIEEVAGADWRTVLSREPHFSEYTLYGIFVEFLGADAAGHFVTDESQVHAVWDDEPETPNEERELIDGIMPHHIAFLIQSTAKMPFSKRLELLARAKERANARP